MKNLKITTLFISIAILFSCEDPIDLDLDTGRSQIVIDGFLTSDSTVQTVKLTKSAAYFLNAAAPVIENANVFVEGPNGKQFDFTYAGGGNYNYDPNTNGKLDSIGFNYQLKVTVDDVSLLGISRLNPVPIIDSMTYDFEDEDPNDEPGYYSQFWARDFIGSNDFYWIKAYKNGRNIDTLQYAQYNLSQNAAFSGIAADGFIFILPIRSSITNSEEPFILGDTSSVELFSLNEDVFNYLIQVSTQANNGGLFATPTANIRTNITDIAGNPQTDAVGVFSISSVSRNSIIIQ